MQTEEFLKKVRVRSGLADNEKAKQAVDAVFGALRARISHEGGDNIASQLPKELRELWESGIVEHVARSLTGVERMNLNEFLARVQNTAHLADINEAEVVTRAVFITLKEQITPGAQVGLAHQLPEDIRTFWNQSMPPEEERLPPEGRYGSEEIGPSAVSVFRTDEQLAEEIEELLEESDDVDTEEIDVYVQQGEVTLRGVVRTSEAWEAAGRIASRVLGVTNVKNELTIIETL